MLINQPFYCSNFSTALPAENTCQWTGFKVKKGNSFCLLFIQLSVVLFTTIESPLFLGLCFCASLLCLWLPLHQSLLSHVGKMTKTRIYHQKLPYNLNRTEVQHDWGCVLYNILAVRLHQSTAFHKLPMFSSCNQWVQVVSPTSA